MSKVVCPYCFSEFNRNEVMFRCTNSRCTTSPDEPLKIFWGIPMSTTPSFTENVGFFGRLIDRMPQSGTCPECQHKSFNTICPVCHNPVPRGMVEDKGYIISIIGARSSGKTNYITVLIDQLKKNLHNLGHIGFRATSVGNRTEDYTTNRYMNDFYNVLYKSGQCPSQTAKTDRKNKVPLIYELTQNGVKPINLVFYDTAGENFTDERDIEANVKFLEQSDAIIYLLDTFAIPAVHEALGLKDEMELNYDVILSNVFTHFTQYHPDKARSFFSKPMALTFSKIDAIIQNEDIFSHVSIPHLNHDSSFLQGTGLNMDEINDISKGIHDALYNVWNEQGFVNNIETGYNVKRNLKYFGISALGKSPDVNNNIKGIEPFRVLDPLAWILHELNYKVKMSQ